MEQAAAHLLDLTQELDISLLDQIVAIAFDGHHPKRIAANEFLVSIKGIYTSTYLTAFPLLLSIHFSFHYLLRTLGNVETFGSNSGAINHGGHAFLWPHGSARSNTNQVASHPTGPTRR